MVENNRILVVDDEVSIQKIFKRILSPPLKTDVLSQGAVLFDETHEQPDEPIHKRFELTLADCGPNGIKAVEETMVKKQPFALAFIDLGLEGIDGVQTARQIWEADPNLKIVFSTGSVNFDPENIYRATGRNDFFHLKKPFSIKEVKEIAQTLTQQWADDQKRREDQHV